MIRVENLIKKYANGFLALDDVSLEIKEGDFFGLLGPNGAGKTTMINILSSLVRKSSGGIFIDGKKYEENIAYCKTLIGLVPQDFNFNVFQTCTDVVLNSAGYYGVRKDLAKERMDVLFDRLELQDKRLSKSGELSGGYKRRLMIARALVHDPKILILDEPTAGADVVLRRVIWEFLEELNKKHGVTIILTTHYLEEAERMCGQIGIIEKGKVIENAPTEKLLGSLKSERVVLECDRPVIDFSEKGYKEVRACAYEVVLTPEVSVTGVVRGLDKEGIVVKRVINKTNRLEELFIGLTSKEKSDD